MSAAGRDDGGDTGVEALFAPLEERPDPEVGPETGVEAARRAAVARAIVLNLALERRDPALQALSARIDELERRQEAQLAHVAELLDRAQGELARFEMKAGALSDRLMRLVAALERR